jgi:hypothetical protein
MCDAKMSRRWFDDHEVLFSSCNLDEFSLASTHRAKELAQLAWAITNRRKLLDHIEIIHEEVAAYQSGRSAVLYDSDPGFDLGWKFMRSGGSPSEIRDQIRKSMKATKSGFREHLQLGRDVFRPFFDRLAELGIQLDWPEFLLEIRNEGSIGRLIEETLQMENLHLKVPKPDEIHLVPYLELPGTTASIEYLIALRFLAARQAGKLGRPDLGDQVDTRHACYAGLSALFVSQDNRMRSILATMVTTRAPIVDLDGMKDILSR